MLERISEGLLPEEIAEGLGIRPRTVATHLLHIYRKLHVQTRSQARPGIWVPPQPTGLRSGSSIRAAVLGASIDAKPSSFPRVRGLPCVIWRIPACLRPGHYLAVKSSALPRRATGWPPRGFAFPPRRSHARLIVITVTGVPTYPGPRTAECP